MSSIVINGTHRLCILGFLAGMLVFATPAMGQTKNYVGGAGASDWWTITNWSPIGVPGNGADAVLQFQFFTDRGLNDDQLNTRTVIYNYQGPTVTLGSVIVDLIGGDGVATTAISMSANTLTSNTEVIGQSGKGDFDQSGGTNTSTGGDLILGRNTGSSGTYNLSGGSLNINNGGRAIVGYSGTGTFIQSGGTASISAGGFLDVNRGTYTLSAGGLNIAGNTYIADTGGQGTFNQMGGTNTISGGSLYLGYEDPNAVGTYNLSRRFALG